MTGYPDLAAGLPLATLAASPRFADVRYRDIRCQGRRPRPLRATAGGSGWLTIVVAHTREERAALATEILANAFLPVLLVVVAASGLIWFGVRRALAPLATIERLPPRPRADRSEPDRAGPVPREVRQLLSALNHFMQRLQANLRLMQSFLADAAHQIRTPLATLRAQAELAIEEDDAATLRSYVHKIHRNAALASQVTNQLLSHAMVVHRGQLAAREQVDLVALLRQVAQRAEAGGDGPPIELDLRELDGAAVIVGDPITLTEAFTNLIDNARKYAGDQFPVQIRVAGAANAGKLQVDVADRGPGIADAEKDRVLERFTRGGSRAAGDRQRPGARDREGGGRRARRRRVALLDRPGGGLVVRLVFSTARLAASAAPRPRGGRCSCLAPGAARLPVGWHGRRRRCSTRR